MTEVFVTAEQLAERLAQRPASYAAELEACVTRREAGGLWIDIDAGAFARLRQKYAPPPAPASHPLAVVTLNVYGDGMRPNARESQRAAAARWGAAFVEITSPLRHDGNAWTEKLHLDALTAGCGRVVYLDRDVVVRDDCPSLFALVPAGTFAAVPSCQDGHDRRDFTRPHLAPVAEAAGVPFDLARDHFNSGVMVFDPAAHVGVFADARALAAATADREWCVYDEGLLSVAAKRSGVPVMILDAGFNRLVMGIAAGWQPRMTDPVWHFAGVDDRDAMIDRTQWRTAPTPPAPAPHPDSWQAKGPELWAALHRRPSDAADLAGEPAWLEAFAGRISCGACRDDWRKLVAAHPPDLSTPAAYFAWGVLLHNLVNRRLGRPDVSLEDAGRRWKFPSSASGCCGGKGGDACTCRRGRDDLPRLDARAMLDFFDAVFLVNLKRRPDRLAGFNESRAACGWPFKEPIVLEALDGRRLPLPEGWAAGDGAYGCALSHRHCIERSLTNGWDRILILEDDAVFPADFGRRAAEFLAAVPGDWDGLFFGGQHMRRPAPFAPGVVKTTNCQRTHAHALRGRYMRDLYRHWVSPKGWGHIDHHEGPFGAAYRVYAPERFICFQGRSLSDIDAKNHGTRTWNTGDTGEPMPAVVHLRAPRRVIDALRDSGWHAGYNRGADGADLGLSEILSAEGSPRVKQRRLREWLGVIQSEAFGWKDGIAVAWHPTAGEELGRLLHRATGGEGVEIVAETAQEAVAAQAVKLKKRELKNDGK